ncbi:cupin domain-containing protein [Hansschlegelia sp. KR7-227]|uniref:cupin domain-containing protein n=1 Tax=Hansschlegelia sp. KR7-227 TaxID=3400914 RepID=UPI003BFA93B9
MKINQLLISFFVIVMSANVALAKDPEVNHASTRETVIPNFSQAIPNVPGKSLVAVEVVYPPSGASLAHRHAKSAFIYGYVVSGIILSQIAGEPARFYRAGESFFEAPGAHHLAGRNASATKPAKLLAVFVVDTGETKLTIPDK